MLVITTLFLYLIIIILSVVSSHLFPYRFHILFRLSPLSILTLFVPVVLCGYVVYVCILLFVVVVPQLMTTTTGESYLLYISSQLMTTTTAFASYCLVCSGSGDLPRSSLFF